MQRIVLVDVIAVKAESLVIVEGTGVNIPVSVAPE